MRKDMAWPEAMDSSVLSCGSFRKPARNLINTAQRKSQRYTTGLYYDNTHGGEAGVLSGKCHGKLPWRFGYGRLSGKFAYISLSEDFSMTNLPL
jgi:L-asparaginase II